MRIALVALLLLAATAVRAELLPNDYEKMEYTQALEAIRAQPDRHVLVYFGMETFCPPCNYTRGLLTGGTLKSLYKPAYLVVPVDLRQPTADGRKAIGRFKVKWAPTLVFLDAKGKAVARVPKGFRNEREAILTHEFVSRKLYARSDLEAYVKANFDARGEQRTIPEKRLADGAPADDRPRLRDILQKDAAHLPREALLQLLPGKRMEKENQDWFLTMALEPGGRVHASGQRKDGQGKMKGEGKWYVTKKGKMCVEVKAGGADETWCRHVFRAGDNYYYATKDRRPDRVAYRFTLETS